VVAGKFLAIFPGEAAAVWLSGIGVQTLATYLQSQGVEIPLGWVLKDCTAMSADGRTFGGVARHTSSRQEYGFVATIPSPSVVLVLSTGLLGVIHKRRRPVALGAISW
jgi:hypothetical protein